jgi:hypothetical protein
LLQLYSNNSNRAAIGLSDYLSSILAHYADYQQQNASAITSAAACGARARCALRLAFLRGVVNIIIRLRIFYLARPSVFSWGTPAIATHNSGC